MAQHFNTSLNKVAFHYLKLLKVPVTKTSCTKYLQENPFYPSLYSLSNTFDKLNIENSAFRVEPGNLQEIPIPFIAFMRNQPGGDDFVLVTDFKNDKIKYSNDGKKYKEATKEQFLKDWKNIVFVAEKNEKSGEPDFINKLQQEQQTKFKNYAPGITALFILLIAALNFITVSQNLFPAVILSLIEFTGLSVTVLLLVYDIDKTNSFVKNICSAGGIKTNCDAVLSSKVSRLFGMSWGEIGFFYFSAITLFTLLPAISFAVKLPYLGLAFSAAAVYIPFSIYYQYKVVKQWCPLCLAVQAVLAAGFAWSLINYWWNNDVHFTFNIYHLTFIITCTLLSIIAWFAIKPVLLKAKDAGNYHAAYKRLLYNPDIFYSLLQQQPKAAEDWQQLGINIGNPAAQTTIIKVCNPYCGPCAKAHPVLENIVAHNNNVKLKIIFTATNDETDMRNKPVKHLLAIAAQNDITVTQKAVDDWYNVDKKDYEAFAQKYPLNGELKMQGDKIEAMRHWCNETGITHTPTIFINGWRLPETYNIEELKNIL